MFVLNSNLFKRFILSLAICVAVTDIYTQNLNLYLINGQYYDTDPNLSKFIFDNNSSGREGEEVVRYFSSCLYRIEGNSLVIVDTLAMFEMHNYYNNEELNAIRLYHDKQTAFVYSIKHNYRSKDTIILRLIDFREPLKNHILKFTGDPFYRYWIVNFQDTIYFVNENLSKDKSWLTKRNIIMKNESVVNFEILNYYISDGYNGLGCDDLYGGFGTKTERLELVRRSIGIDTIYYINHTDTPVNLPFSDQFIQLDNSIERITPHNSFISLTISNDDMYVISRRPKIYNNNWYCQFLIYNKKSKKLDIQSFKGSYRSIRAFGSWITGNQTYVGTLGINNKSIIGTEVPGKKYRNQEYSNFSSPADFRFEKLKIYPTGILFLYDINSKKYFEWQATENGEPQGDSEILLVRNNEIYYRINDKIYKRLIINSKLGNEQLLLQDEMVTSIHWAFLSEN